MMMIVQGGILSMIVLYIFVQSTLAFSLVASIRRPRGF